MAKRNTGETDSSVELGSQAWNIADGYTKVKILRLTIQLDLDEEIAMFGKKDDMDYIPPHMIPEKRVEAFDKMIFHLRQLIGNCRFAIEKGTDHRIVNTYFERIRNVELVSNRIAKWNKNDVTKEDVLEINEDHFKTCFDALRDVKDGLNFLLNKAGLIFRQSDDIDLDKIMQDIEEGG